MARLSGLIRALRVVMAPESCNLDDLPPRSHMNDLKAAADNARTAETLFDLLWCGIGGDIEVLGFFTQKEVADGTAHDISLKASIL